MMAADCSYCTHHSLHTSVQWIAVDYSQARSATECSLICKWTDKRNQNLDVSIPEPTECVCLSNGKQAAAAAAPVSDHKELVGVNKSNPVVFPPVLLKQRQ
jgi:hypothetical protein